MSLTGAARTVAKRVVVDSIVDVAIGLIEEEGFEGLTMRALAERCGMGAMTLYTYFGTKDDLLISIADRYLGELSVPDTDGLTWQEQVAEVFRALWAALLDHAEFAPILATHSVTSAGSYRTVEFLLQVLRGAGLSDRDAATAVRTLRHFTVGAAQREAARRATATDPEERLERINELPADEFSHSRELAPLLNASSFEDSLQLLLDGISYRLDAGRSRARSQREERS